MLSAARAGNWDEVVKLEGACVLLISQLKQAAQDPGGRDKRAEAVNAVDSEARAAAAEAARSKSRIMQRILVNDAEIRQLAEPWLQTLDDALEGRRRTLH
ncbi:MAG: flagellar protein FliT [Rubrivivax sp.]|nr:flagellar protein FliT [Rubrivivax sp.]